MRRVGIGNGFLKKNISLEQRLLFMWLMVSVLTTVSRYILSKLGIYGAIRTCWEWFLAFVPITVFFVNITKISRQKYSYFFFIFFLAAFSFLITAILNPDMRYFFTRANYGLVRVFRPDAAIYALLFFSLVEDIDKLLAVVRIYAYFNFSYLFIFLFLPAFFRGGWIDVSSKGVISIYPYNLSFGYAMLFSTIIFLYLYSKEKKILHLILGVSGLLLILTNGSRGALLMPIIFFVLMTVNDILNIENAAWKFLKTGLIAVACLFFLIAKDAIISSVVNFLINMGFKSRTLTLLVNGEVAGDNGRSVIWDAVQQAIDDGGIFGYGAYGDRPFVYPIHYVAYAHNLFLELQCSYGIIGLLISGIMVVSIIRMLLFCKDTKTREVFIIFVSIAAQLLVSFSFWYVWEFWATIAIAHNYFKKVRYQNMLIRRERWYRWRI